MIRRIILSSNTSTGALVLKPCSLLCLLTLALPHSINLESSVQVLQADVTVEVCRRCSLDVFSAPLAASVSSSSAQTSCTVAVFGTCF
jgi:hypothetical protein